MAVYRLAIGRLDASADHVVDLDRDVVLVGRRAGADVPLPDPAVGGVHLRLERHDGAVVLVDGGIQSGTKVAGERLAPGARRTLNDGEEIVVAGVFRLRYLAAAPAGAHATSADGTAALARAMVRDVLAALGKSSHETAPSLQVIAGPARGKRFELPPPGRDLVIGRGETCDAAIIDSDLSREHARVHREWSGATVADLGSKNGTRVGGTRLATGTEQRLRHGDEISLGATVLRYTDPTEEYLRDLPPEPAPEPIATPAPALAPLAVPVPVHVPVPVPEKPNGSGPKLKNLGPSPLPSVLPSPENLNGVAEKGKKLGSAPLILVSLLILAALAALIALLRA